MSDHAILSPSSAGRWLTCTPSARLELQFEDQESDFAREGTLAHAIAEALLKSGHAQLDLKVWQQFKKQEFYTEAMYEHVQNFANYVYEIIDKDTKKPFKRWLSVERRLDLSSHVPEGFGTSDALLINNRTLHVFDLKYGKGVPVSAENNKQLKIYALGALDELGHLWDIDNVILHIYQPRLNNISTFEISVDELNFWGDTVLKPGARLAFDGEGEFKPGDHCQFCRAKAMCRALADYNLELVKDAFRDPALLSDVEFMEVYDKKKIFESWIKAVGDFALAQALGGKKWPGHKLVEGRSNRQYKSEEELVKVLTRHLNFGYLSEIYKPKELLGLEEMTKKLGSANFKQYVEPLLVKPPGAPTLAPVSDPRPVYSSAAKGFTVYYDDDFMN